MRTLANNVKVVNSLRPQAVGTGATVNGAFADTLGYEEATACIEIGAIASGSDKGITVSVYEDDAGSNVTEGTLITGATTGELLDTGEGNQIFLISVNTSEHDRYLRLKAVGSSGGGALASGIFLLSDGRGFPTTPPTQDNTVIYV